MNRNSRNQSLPRYSTKVTDSETFVISTENESIPKYNKTSTILRELNNQGSSTLSRNATSPNIGKSNVSPSNSSSGMNESSLSSVFDYIKSFSKETKCSIISLILQFALFVIIYH